MASQIAGVLDSIHGFFRPVLKLIEINSICGIIDLRIGTIIVVILQFLIGGLDYIPGVHIPHNFWIVTLVLGILLLFGAILKLRILTAPWLISTFILILVVIVYFIINLIKYGFDFSDFLGVLLTLIIYLVGFSIVYSFHMKMDDLPTVNPA